MVKILAADIGGTNSRFAMFDNASGRLVMEDSIWLHTQEAASFSQLLEQLWESDFKAVPGDFQSAVLAIPGAIRDGVECRQLPNVPWSVDLRVENFGMAKACLINDFTAQAYACRTSAVDDAIVLQEGEPLRGIIGVIGAGTGLGYSALVPGEREWTALPSEGGHMSFPFSGEEELGYAEFNLRETGCKWVDGDNAVAGRGLHLLHKYLTGEDLTPKEISARITPESETTKWYARFYGRACRNWVMALVAHGGLYISGGIAAKNPMFVNVPEFLEEFHNCHVYQEFLHSVPVKLNTNEESGLYGAAFHGAQLLKG